MTTEIVFLDKTIEQKALAQSFAGAGAANSLIKQIEMQSREKASDLSADTPQGRKEIVSLAAHIASAKVSLDGFGKSLTEEAQEKINIVNFERKKIREQLDLLKAEIRQPVTDFENAEKERINNANDLIKYIESLFAIIDKSGNRLTVEQLQENLSKVNDTDTSVEALQEFSEHAKYEKNKTASFLEIAIEEAEKREAEQLELARLRQLQAEQEVKDHEEAIRKEAENKAKQEVQEALENAERERVADIQRLEREKQEVIEKAEQEKQAAIDAEKKRLDEESVKAEEQAQTEADELKRQNDKEHRQKIHTEIKDGIINLGLSNAHAVTIVKAIISGEIPNVTINY